jgi:hypothetical protein
MNNNEVVEYINLLETARQWVADDDSITDKEGCARRMVEAYFRGRLDRERIDAIIAEQAA